MKYLTVKEPKKLKTYIHTRLVNHGYKYRSYKSPVSHNRSFYLRNLVRTIKTIRISDHDLHVSQYKANQIDVVIQADMSVKINKKTVQPDETQSYRFMIVKKIIEILKGDK